MGKKKVILIGRHGKAPKNSNGTSIDSLYSHGTPDIPKHETVTGIYQKGIDILRPIFLDYGILPNATMLKHTKKIRTKNTGLLWLIGAFDMQPKNGSNPPRTMDDISNYDTSMIETSEDDGIIYHAPDVNLDIYGIPNEGPVRVMNHWLNNRHANTHEGVPIEPFNSVMSRSKKSLKEGLAGMYSGSIDAAVYASHNGQADSLIVQAIESCSAPIEDINDIGGLLNENEFSLMTLTDKGSSYDVKIKHKGIKYKVDIGNL